MVTSNKKNFSWFYCSNNNNFIIAIFDIFSYDHPKVKNNMLRKAIAPITNWNWRLLNIEVSSRLGKFLPSHLSHFSHAVKFSFYSLEGYWISFTFLSYCFLFSFSSLAASRIFSFYSAFFFFSYNFWSSFFFSWSGNSFMYSLSLLVVWLNTFSWASLSLTS